MSTCKNLKPGGETPTAPEPHFYPGLFYQTLCVWRIDPGKTSTSKNIENILLSKSSKFIV
jgi:hypothetical protein